MAVKKQIYRRGNHQGTVIVNKDKTVTIRRQYGRDINGKRIIKNFRGKTKTEAERLMREYDNTIYGFNQQELKNVILYVLNNCFTKAVQKGDLLNNPMTGVDLPSEDRVLTKTKKIETLNEEDIVKIQNIAQETLGNSEKLKYYYGFHILFLLYTGLRFGEALALTWKDIDFEKKTININKNMMRVINRNDDERKNGFKVSSTKTNSSNRIVPLSDGAISALRIIKSNNVLKGEDDRVFMSKNGKVVEHANFVRCLNKIQEKANTSIQKSGIHMLRHTFATILLKNGVDIKIVSELLGHKKVSTTYDIYVHVIPKQKQDSILVLDKIK